MNQAAASPAAGSFPVPEFLRLRHCTMLDSGAGTALRLIVGEDYFDLSEETGTRESFLRLKSLLDGRHSLEDIVARTGSSAADVEAAVTALGACGLLRQETPLAMVPARELRPKLEATLAMWRRQIGCHKLFESLMRGQVRIEVLQGLFIETYHVVRLAPQHIATAIAAATDPRLRDMLCEYLADELNHEGMLLETCVNLGCRRAHVVSAHPTVGTLSLVHMPSELGRRDTLAYIAGTSLFEALPEDEQEGEASVAELARLYGFGAGAFGPALRHLQMDAHSGHASLLSSALEGAPDLPAERMHVIVNMLHDLKHAYDLHQDQILHYFGDISNYIPPPNVDYFSL